MEKNKEKTRLKVGITINEEKLSTGKTVFVAHCNELDVTSQGKTFEEVRKNITEAIEIEIEECPEKLDRFIGKSEPVFTIIEIPKNVKTSNTLWKTTC